MSTRKGTLIELEELIKQSVEKSKEILRQKNKDLGEKEIEEISEIVGLGAVIYNDLRQSRQKIFLLTGTGCWILKAAAPFHLQYTFARINSILKKCPECQGETLTLTTLKKIANLRWPKK